MRKLTTKGFYGGCYKKSGLDIDDKKTLEIESEACTKPLLMAQSLFETKRSQYRN
ncbi:hypothetical protein [Helicobacter pylori]|uniref:hypothetical protein n=1 Tax=Helicobacter pylori TaxID=210 RepID=UPI0018E2250E|nr:hypothetical protein [Helicobacter pylori]